MDFFTNQVYYFELLSPHDRLDVIALSQVETFPDTRDLSVFSAPSSLVDLYQSGSFYDFLIESRLVRLTPIILHEARELIPRIDEVRQAVERIMGFVFEAFVYRSGVTDANTRADEAFAQRVGVCQDFAHVMIALCRVLRIPARYVSGYFFVDREKEGIAVVDNTESHAWVDCFLPGIGWVGYDPTHNRLSDERYNRVAVGRDYSDVKPVSGTFRGQSRVIMEVSVDVSRDESGL